MREVRAVEPGGSGHLQIRGIRGLSLFQEYPGDPAATAAAFDPDGCLRSGDRVNLLEDGSIQCGDRDRDMLKVGGENLAASAIERVILGVPGVHACAVVAKKHLMPDELPIALVLPTADCAPQLGARVLAACAPQLGARVLAACAPQLGARVLAACAPQLGARVLAACAAPLADFKHPREIRVVDDLPRSTLEKIAKAELRRRVADAAAT